MACQNETNATQTYKGIPLPTTNLSEEDREQVMVEIVDTLLYKSGLPNMTLSIACGIAGNIKQESKFNYTAIGDNGNSYGLCQWNKNRLEKLYNFCKENNLSYTSVDGQVKYLVHELNNGYKNVYSTISSPEYANDLDKVTEYFCLNFESPKYKETVCPKRIPAAREVLKEYKRLKGLS